MIEVKPKKGKLVRLVHERTVRADCNDCERAFTNTGAAASHARSHRHTVAIIYLTRFTYAPRERVNGA